MAPRRPRAPVVASSPTPTTPAARQPGSTTASVSPPAPTLAATATPVSFLRTLVSADTIPHHLVFTTLALLLASGLIVRRMHSKNRYRAPPSTSRGVKKRKQDVVKSILIAQGQDDGTSAGKSRSRSGSTIFRESYAALMPSASCIASTSAAIWSNLEKIGSTFVPSRAVGSSTAQPQDKKAETISQLSSDASTPPIRDAGKEGGASAKRGKNKKGKAVAAGSATPLGAGKGGSNDISRDMSRASSKQGEESGLEVIKVDQGIQVSRSDVELSSLDRMPTPSKHIPTRAAELDANALSATPHASSLGGNSRAPTVTASVQTSPRLLPYRTRSRSPSPSPPRPTVSSAPPSRPIAVPLTFDLHASFQATPPSALPETSRSASPSLSSTPSRSPSNSPSVSSGSPTGRRPSAASSSLQTAAGAKSRKQSKKATPTGLNGRAIVGLPRPAESFEDDDNGGTEREEAETKFDRSSSNAGTVRANGRERPAPIPIPVPSNLSRPLQLNDCTPQPQRRLSAASSSAHSVSSMSFMSSGSPYSTDRAGLHSAAPAPSMTMTPPDFARKPSTSTIYDRDETLRWTSSTSTSTGTRGREASLRGLGVEIERSGGSEDGSLDGRARSGGGSMRGSSPNPLAPGASDRHASFTSPESSPHTAPRSLATFDSPSPWTSHGSTNSISTPMGPSATVIPYPIASSTTSAGGNASRPPSRQSSLSVPVNISQQQQLHLQQQQQAYAIAQVQAQAAAQYQHVVALQYQAQLQMQQQQQQQQQHQQPRRKPGDVHGGLEDVPQIPNGLVYPLNSMVSPTAHAHGANWPPSGGVSHSASPLGAIYPPHLSQAVSPTTATFGNGTMSPHSQAQMYQSYINQSAAYYLAATSSPSPHSSSSHHLQQQQHPTRPRISSSVSAVAVLGGGGGGGGGSAPNHRNPSMASPNATSSLSSPRVNGAEKQRQGSANPFSPPGPGAAGATPSDAVAVWKARAKEAEMEAGRNAKELEIARWRLSVLEGEQQANEFENQEALRALATRAMRAEARIKLLEDIRKPDLVQSSPPSQAVDSSPSPSPAAASPSAPKPTELPWSTAGESVGGPGSTLHPLSWLDLDSVSFSTRPLTSASSRPPLTSSHSSNSNGRRRSGRNSYGNGASSNGNGNGRRQSGNHAGRRKSSNQNHGNPVSPSLHLSVPNSSDGAGSAGRNEDFDEDEDEVVIVLNASRKPNRSPSRRSSYTASIAGQDDSLLSIGGMAGGGEDTSSFIDEDDIPTIEFDSEPTTHSRIHLVNPLQQSQDVGGGSSDSQSGSVIESEQHEDYVGFLPGFLAKVRASSGPDASRGVRMTSTDQGHQEPDGERDSPVAVAADSTAVNEATAGIRRDGERDNNAKTLDENSDTCPRPDSRLDDEVAVPLATPDSPRRPPLYHPSPIRPSQIALPPSPTSPASSLFSLSSQ